MKWIFPSEDRAMIDSFPPEDFHARWALGGWNDHIIQPALDAALDYYRVCKSNISYIYSSLLNSNCNYFQRYAEASDVEEYMRINNLS